MLQKAQVLQGQYCLQQRLGQNPQRQTWLAEDLGVSPTEPVIVKLLAFSPQMQWDDFKLFEREAQVLQNLAHPYIPRYRDYFSLDQQIGHGLYWFALVQDYIPGASLQQRLDQGQHFTEAQLRQIARDVLNILIYLHELDQPVLHRDIKPSNLILAEDGQVYLVDFGAVQTQAATEGVTFTVVGTTGYAPLEQFWGRAVPASDLYALGATLIYLLTGVPPADLPQKNLQIQFSDRVSINPTFVHWIEALVAPDLAQRYSSARQALDDLNANRFLNAPLQKVRPPVGSLIQVWQSPTQLKIEIPGRGLGLLRDLIIFWVKILVTVVATISQWILFFEIAGLILIGGLAFLTILTANFYHLNFILVLSLILVLMLLVRFEKAITQEIKTANSKLHFPKLSEVKGKSIHFTQDYFKLEMKLMGLVYLRTVAKTSDINIIQKIPLQGITIKTKVKTYLFGKGLTESELNWLMHQIQNWLS